MDKRKMYFAVIDTETTGLDNIPALNFPLIYDLAWTICDKKGNIYEQKNYIIREIFYSRKMVNAYYGKKIPIYKQMIKNGEVEVVSFKKAIYELNKVLEKYPKITISAYNLKFDLRALKSTAKFTGLKWFNGKWESVFFKPYSIQDIWGMAVETLAIQKGYKKFLEKHKFFSEKGNPKSSAETVYRFLHNNPDFIEDHTALSDTIIETHILSECYRQKKKFTKGIHPAPFWKLKEVI